MAKFSLKNSIASSRTDENGMQWYETAEYTDVKEYIKNHIMKIKENYLAIGYWLKYVNERKDYEKDGFSSIWEFAEVNYKISDSTALRLMQINTEFSVNGNSPELDDKYKGFSKSQLQELLYISAEQREEITPDMTVKQIREIRKADANIPTADNIKKFFDMAINRYDDTFDSSKFKEFLIKEYGKSYYGGNFCGCDVKCTPRGVALEDADEITWAQLVKLINELLASRELVLPSNGEDAGTEEFNEVKVETTETYFNDTDTQISGQMEIEDYPEIMPANNISSHEDIVVDYCEEVKEVHPSEEVFDNKDLGENKFTIESKFSADALFEYSVAIDGLSYLIIYGKHINGYFCCIPNWQIGCEMASPNERLYNSTRLVRAGMDSDAAIYIAESIQYMHEMM